ncbi:MAG: hypothetical protein SFY96_05055, partial [Planctomycetota bacterium]|nr:hypothetical protein [Planctomycetota bacterium]
LLDGVNARQFDRPVNPALLIAANDAASAWSSAFADAVAARNAAEAATQNKQHARAAYEAALRPIVRQLQSLPEVTNGDRASLGITVASPRRSVVPPPPSPRVAIVDAGARLTHTLRLFDTAALAPGGNARGRTARPRGAARAELFVAFTPPGSPAPSDLDAFRYVQSISDGHATLSFDAARGGQQAHYLARWVNTAGQPGPWSETASATVAA